MAAEGQAGARQSERYVCWTLLRGMVSNGGKAEL